MLACSKKIAALQSHWDFPSQAAPLTGTPWRIEGLQHCANSGWIEGRTVAIEYRCSKRLRHDELENPTLHFRVHVPLSIRALPYCLTQNCERDGDLSALIELDGAGSFRFLRHQGWCRIEWSRAHRSGAATPQPQ